jgi:hypothetical protein
MSRLGMLAKKNTAILKVKSELASVRKQIEQLFHEEASLIAQEHKLLVAIHNLETRGRNRARKR